MWNDRTKLLLGEKGLKALQVSHVTVVGLGGVGGHACICLARAGVEHFTLIDFDVVDETNINRQVVANVNTVGRLKAEVLKEQILQINPKCQVQTVTERLSAENIARIISLKTDFVLDAIDQIAEKVELICYCKQHGLNIVSAMGAGNRIALPQFKVTDIFKTTHDGLAKCIRKKLRERGISGLDVVVCQAESIKLENTESVRGKRTLGSISYFPAVCGCVMAAHVVGKICENT